MRVSALATTILLMLLGCGDVSAPSPASGEIQVTNVFEAETGGYAHYRVPAIAVSPSGTVMVVVEARASASGDWGHQDILMRRSTDGGRTWDDPRKIVQLEGPPAENEAALAQYPFADKVLDTPIARDGSVADR